MKILHVIILVIVGAAVSYYIISAFILQQQSINKQSIYVHLQPEWQSYPANLVFDITNVWAADQNEPLDTQNRLQLAKENGANQIGYVHNKSYIVAQHDNTNCRDKWEPHYARFGADVIRHHVEYLAGLQQSPDPHVNMFTLKKSKQDAAEHQLQIKSGYLQFIPICTKKQIVDIDYSIRISDDAVGFDVYFVPSAEEQKNYDAGSNSFTYYEGCSGLNYASFSGTCHNVSKNSGLLVVIPDNLRTPLTKLEIWFYEK